MKVRHRLVTFVLLVVASAAVIVGALMVAGVGAAGAESVCKERGISTDVLSADPGSIPLDRAARTRFPVIGTSCAWSTSNDTRVVESHVDRARTSILVGSGLVAIGCVVVLARREGGDRAGRQRDQPLRA